MHDPQTVCFDIKRPWPIRRSKPFMGSRWYWPTLVTIWHVDPESDGSDDSCGWSHPKVPKSFRDDMGFYGGCEERSPWLLRDHSKDGPLSIVDAEAKFAYVVAFTARRLKLRISYGEAQRIARELIHNPVDNIRSSLCFVAGYHSNFPNDDQEGRAEAANSIYATAARVLLRNARPWYRHPRWHVHHWKIQIHPLQAFKRWAWSTCASCGKGFTWGYAPTTFQWHGGGPQWFKSESGVYHSGCTPTPPSSSMKAE